LGSLSHSYANIGSYTVTVSVKDKDNATGTASFAVSVANVAPTVTAPANQSSNEDQKSVVNLGTFSDPGASDAPWAVDVNWGDGSAHGAFTTGTQGSLGSLSHTYADGPATRTVAVTVTDKDGGTGTATFTVAVANVAPTVTAPASQSSN